MAKKDFTSSIGKRRGIEELIMGSTISSSKPIEPTEITTSTELIEKTEPTNTIKETITTTPIEPIKKIEPIEITKETILTKPAKKTKEKTSNSQTFYIYDIENDIIENFVAYKRMNGDVRFSKKSAISEALELLKESEKKGVNFTIPKVENSLRQNRSYTVSNSDWNFINEIYIKKRMQGDTNFTFSNVISAALILLQTKYPNLKK